MTVTYCNPSRASQAEAREFFAWIRGDVDQDPSQAFRDIDRRMLEMARGSVHTLFDVRRHFAWEKRSEVTKTAEEFYRSACSLRRWRPTWSGEQMYVAAFLAEYDEHAPAVRERESKEDA